MLTAEDLALYDDVIRSQLPPDAGSWLEPATGLRQNGRKRRWFKGATAIVVFRMFAEAITPTGVGG